MLTNTTFDFNNVLVNVEIKKLEERATLRKQRKLTSELNPHSRDDLS